MQGGQLTSLVRIYRGTEGQNERAETVTTYADAGRAWIDFRAHPTRYEVAAAGERPTGVAEARAHHHAGIRGTDVLEVIAGPQRGSWWRVGLVSEPTPGELLLPLEPYTGSPLESGP